MNDTDKLQLERAIDHITNIAIKLGLDFYPMRYEICPPDIIYTFGAYGMPTRFSHWSFGKNFQKMKMQYDYGLSKIYELVINSNPCYAFLLEGNSLIQNKLIIAHVLAHSDFFKNNARFSRTNRNMIETMSATADRIHRYEYEHGIDTVESFIDAVLSVQEHIDPSLIKTQHQHKSQKSNKYPEKDILLFILTHSTALDDWQRDILTMLREEMLYFWPQLETKIMNEGWATYWHLQIVRELDLTSEETIEFAKLNAAIMQPSQHTINPYHLGYKIFEDIERRWNRDKLFDVREFESDSSFLRNYLTEALVEDMDLYVFEKKGLQWKVTDKAWERIRDELVTSRVNGGFPYLMVEDANYTNQGELLIKHYYEGAELDLNYLEKTLPFLYTLWGKSVHLLTQIEAKDALFTYDGTKCHRRFL